LKIPHSTVVILLAASLRAQSPAPVFYQQLREFLHLTDSQWDALIAADSQYTAWKVVKYSRVAEMQHYMPEEIAKPMPNPGELGVRYAEIVTICREIRNRAADVERTNVKMLTDAQRAKLKQLDDAIVLLPEIAQAQSIRLLGGPAIPDSGLVTSVADRFLHTSGNRLGTLSPAPTELIPGCY